MTIKTENGSMYRIYKHEKGVFANRVSSKKIWSEIFFGWLKNSENITYRLKNMPRVVIGEQMVLEKDSGIEGNFIITGKVVEVHD